MGCFSHLRKLRFSTDPGLGRYLEVHRHAQDIVRECLEDSLPELEHFEVDGRSLIWQKRAPKVLDVARD